MPPRRHRQPPVRAFPSDEEVRSWQPLNFVSAAPNPQQSVAFDFIRQVMGQIAAPQRTAMDEVMRLNPPSFNGQADPPALEQWLSHMDKIFRVTRCPAEERTIIAAYYLEGVAEGWWANEEATRGDLSDMSWEEFKQRIRTWLYPPQLPWSLAELCVATFRAACEQAASVYVANQMVYDPRRDEVKENVKGKGSEGHGGNSSRTFREKVASAPYAKKPGCPQCRKNHLGTRCDGRPIICFYCNEAGHTRRACPKRMGCTPGSSSRGPVGLRGCPRCGKDHVGMRCDGQQITCYHCGDVGHTRRRCPGLAGNPQVLVRTPAQQHSTVETEVFDEGTSM